MHNSNNEKIDNIILLTWRVDPIFYIQNYHNQRNIVKSSCIAYLEFFHYS